MDQGSEARSAAGPVCPERRSIFEESPEIPYGSSRRSRSGCPQSDPAIDLVVLNRARRLAYFILQNKTLALEITAAALAKVETMTARQDRRFAYRPKKYRNKVSLSSTQLLQSLILCESESYEKSQEASGGKDAGLGAEDLLVRYIKHLIRISIWRNSFYVTLALCKFLYGYSTEETVAIYDLVSQDPGCRYDDDYYRSRKSVLLKEIKSRFGGLITRCRGARGEERFQCREACAAEIDLVRDCLSRFTPWNTECGVPDGLCLWEEAPADLRLTGEDPEQDHLIEVKRIHAVLHPDCFLRLTRALGLDLPEKRLVIPRFSQR